MNLLKNTLVSKLMLVALMLVGAKAMSAESKLYIEPVVIDDYTVRSIPVVLEHDGTMGALNFDIELSKSLEFEVKGKEVNAITRNPGFLADGQQMTTSAKVEGGYENSQTARVMIVSRRGNAFPANKGVVAYINVKAKKDALDKTIEKDPELFISVKRVTVTAAAGDKNEKIADKTYDVSQISEIKLGVTGGDFIMNPKGKKNVMLNLANNVDVATFMFDLELPEGFKVDYSNCGFTKRASNGAWLDYFPSKTEANKIRFIVSDIETNKAISGKSGDIMWLALEAPESFGEEVVLKFSKVEVGTVEGKTFYGPDFETKLANGKSSYDKALAELKTIDDAFAAAQKTISEKCADVKDQFKGEAIAADIAALKKAVEDAYANTTLGADYDKIMAPKAEIEKSIAKLVEDATAAQAKLDAEKALKAAADKATAEIKALNDGLAAALATIAKECPLVADDFKGENVADAIKALQTKVDAAIADGTLPAKYDEVMAPAKEIAELTATLVKEAKDAQAIAENEAKAEADRVAKNKAAYEADLAEVAKLEAELQAVVDGFKAEWTNLFPSDKNDVIREIKNTKKDIESEKARVAIEGEYVSQVDAQNIRDMIAYYKNLVETSGIDSIVADENLGNVRIYTIDGVQHNRLVPGVNIIVKEDGTTSKVYVK